ncbi:MAG: hypothetical protein LC667_15550 [Thioalkalivibrio sp.]|nr:hypothetical protein [Thioalkalivibrio sp.]
MTPETPSAALRESATIKIQWVEGQAVANLKIIATLIAALALGNAVFFGNGGSAADSQRLAGDWEACTRIILAAGTSLEPCC